MFYSGVSAGGAAGVSQPPQQQLQSQQQTSRASPSNVHGGYVDVNQLAPPQNFVVITNNSNGGGGGNGGGGNNPSGSGGCNCSVGYAMSCDSINCVNKFQQHNQVHMTHSLPQQPRQQIISTTSSGEQIITYNLPPTQQSQPQDQQQQQDEELSSEMMHDMAINQSIEEVTNAVIGDMKMSGGATNVEISSASGAGTTSTALSRANEKELRRQRLAELARLRYQNLSKEEKKAVNSRRMLLRKRKRQREREMEELEQILRSSNDIEEDAVFIGDLREKRQRENRARAARSRYHSMTPEERRVYNQKRRMRQLGIVNGNEPSSSMDADVIKEHIKLQNARKAELARQRYHRMSADERKLYNKRRTESLRRRRMEEETLLATPAGQIDSDALQRAQQIMIRNAIRAEKARERYKRKAPEERERKRTTRPVSHKVIKQEHHIGAAPQLVVVGGVAPPPSTQQRQDDSGDILSAIERDLERRTQEARQVLQQRRDGGGGVIHVKQEELLHPEVINVGPGGVVPTTILHGGAGNPAIHTSSGGGGPYATQIVHAAPAGMHGEVKPTKYVQYMQLPAGTTQSGILLADGQFVALQDVHGYAIEPPGAFDNSFQHINPSTVLRAAGPPGGPPGAPQPIIIGQRVELINADQHGGATTAVTYHPHHSVASSGGNPPPNTIHVVNYGGSLHHHHPQQQQQHHPTAHHHQLQQHPHQIIAQEPPPPSHHHQQHPPHHLTGAVPHPQQHHYITTHPVHHQQPPPPQHHIINPATASTSTNASASSVGEMTVLEQKIMSQRAKRAERARRRYHEMSAEARHEFNAKRAHALKMARLKDEELCRLGDEIDANGAQADDELRRSIEQARIRRAKRAETARQKYQKMSPKERKIHNAMRDAQRRQRKREMEEEKTNV